MERGSQRPPAGLPASTASREADPPREGMPRLDEVHPPELLRRCAADLLPGLGPLCEIDLEADGEMPPVWAPPEPLAGLVRHLIACGVRAVGDEWGTLTLSAGLVGGPPRPLADGDPTEGLAPGGYALIEIHDTGRHDAAEARERLEKPGVGAADGEPGQALLEGLGGRARVVATPGGGTAVQLVLPL